MLRPQGNTAFHVGAKKISNPVGSPLLPDPRPASYLVIKNNQTYLHLRCTSPRLHLILLPAPPPPQTNNHAPLSHLTETGWHSILLFSARTHRTTGSRLPAIMAAATLSVRPNRLSPGSPLPLPPAHLPGVPPHALKACRAEPWRCFHWRIPARAAPPVQASSRADDSAPFEMSVENALKLLGVPETASFDEILRAKNSIVAACKDNQEAIAQVIECC